MRVEVTKPVGSWRGVMTPRQWWIASSHQVVFGETDSAGRRTANFDPFWIMLEPNALAEELVMVKSEDVVVAGRECRRYLAHSNGRIAPVPALLAEGADDYDICVDSETGIVLKVASRLGGRHIDERAVLELDLPTSLPPSTFTEEIWPEYLEVTHIDQLPQ